MKRIEDYYGELPFPLTEGQQRALVGITRGDYTHCSILGINGSGKTTIMELLKKFYGDEIIFCASSGVASKNLPNNIGVGTSHSVLSLSTEMADDHFISKGVSRTTNNLFQSSSLIKVVVVDEAFALDSDKLYTMFKRIERFNKATKSRQARSIRLILVGDCCQRLPIASKEDKQYMTNKHGHWLMFKSNLWTKYKIKTFMLTEVKRQEDKVFKACLDVIRYGQTHRYEGALAWINQRVSAEYDESALLLAPTNAVVTRANELSLANNPNKKATWKATITGKYNMKDSPLKPSVTLAIGSPVIGVINQEGGDFCNGSFGYVTAIYPDGCEVKFTGNDYSTFVGAATLREEETVVIKDVVQPDGTLKDIQSKKVVGTCTGLPLLLASAYTVARSQGKTFTCKINIDVGDTRLYTSKALGDFGTSDVLVALSRATSIDNITLLRKIEPAHIKVCQESVKFWNDTLAEQEELQHLLV